MSCNKGPDVESITEAGGADSCRARQAGVLPVREEGFKITRGDLEAALIEGRSALIACGFSSEVQLHCKLENPRIKCLRDLPERCRIYILR